jgi:DUF1009 family protein/predicted dehydrogenase
VIQKGALMSEEVIGLIAGGGQFPLLFANAAREAGVKVVAVGFEGETDLALAELVDEFHLLKLGQLNRLIKTFKKANVTRAGMAGTINKTRLFTKVRLDWRAFKFLRRLKNKKDDLILRALADELQSEGIRIESSTVFLPSLLAPRGILTRRKPNRREQADIQFGWQIAKSIGDLDIGQCIVIKDQTVVAVESIDGTDATILRGGRLCRQGAVVIKVSKPIQDLRFDVPAVGLTTIEIMKQVQAKVLVLEAGKTLMFDRDKTIDAADEAGISIVVYKGAGEISKTPSTQDFLAELSRPKALTTRSSTPSIQPLIREPRSDALRVAVIGVGYLGQFHAQKYAKLSEAKLVAVVDINELRARKTSGIVCTEAVCDYKELLGQVDAVSVATPTTNHHAIARDFLSAGVHVLLEKPMTQTLQEADQLIALARENGCILQIGHLERFNPAFQAIAPQIQNPMFLEADRMALFNDRGLEVDVILDLMIHDLDIVLHIVNSPVERIRAAGIPVMTSLPDIANTRLEFANGAIANLTASRISVKAARKLRIFQENCYLVADYGNKRAYRFSRENGSDDSGFPEIAVDELEIDERDALEEEILSFLQAIRHNRKPVVDASEGRHALAVALDISHQIREGLGHWEASKLFRVNRLEAIG